MLSFHRPIEVLHGFGFPVWTRVLTADTHGAYTGPPMNKRDAPAVIDEFYTLLCSYLPWCK